MSIFTDQKEFMVAGSQEVSAFDDQQSQLYVELIEEEFNEFAEAVALEPKECQVKECVDIMVVAVGWLLSQGIDPQKAWDLIHQNNMAKVNAVVVKDAKGKIIKSPESIARKNLMMTDIKAMVPL